MQHLLKHNDNNELSSCMLGRRLLYRNMVVVIDESAGITCIVQAETLVMCRMRDY